MEARDIFERDKLGEEISHQDPEYHKIREMIDEAQKLLFELNNKYHEEPEVRRLFSQLTGIEVEKTFRLRPPFYTDFGKNIRVGKNVFINHCCTFMDRGGITLEEGVLIGPKVNLITINHPLEPHRRHSTISSPILIKKNAWVGAAATIMPGVTIGENAVVAAGAVVTKDIPAYAVVAGNPAHIIKYRFDKEYIDELLKIDFSKIDKNIVKYNEKLFFDEVGDYKKLRILPQKDNRNV